jgi:hypothetical protein
MWFVLLALGTEVKTEVARVVGGVARVDCWNEWPGPVRIACGERGNAQGILSPLITARLYCLNSAFPGFLIFSYFWASLAESAARSIAGKNFFSSPSMCVQVMKIEDSGVASIAYTYIKALLPSFFTTAF